MTDFFAVSAPLFDNFNDGGGGAAPSPAGGDTPAHSPSPATPDNSAAAPATPNANAPAARPQANDGMVPSYRLREIREQSERQFQQHQQQWAQREAQYQAQMEAIRRQLHAVVGVQPQNEEDAQIAAIQAQFRRVYPDLAQMNERAKDILGMLEARGDYDTAIQHQWQSYGRQSMERLFALAEKSYGQPLSDQQKQRLHGQFSGYVQSSPDVLQRYASDPSLVDEFWQDFENAFVSPVRRSQHAAVQSQAETRPPLPRDTSAVPPGIPAVQQPKDIDQRVQGAWHAFNAVKNQGGR